MTENQETPFWKKIILGICIAEAVVTLLFPLYFLIEDAVISNTLFAYWFLVLPMIVGIVLSFSYLNALKGIVSFGKAFKMSLKPVVPFVMCVPLFLILGSCLPGLNLNVVIYGMITYGIPFGALGVPVFLEIMLIFYFCFRMEKHYS